jgi:hypothetical protein
MRGFTAILRNDPQTSGAGNRLTSAHIPTAADDGREQIMPAALGKRQRALPLEQKRNEAVEMLTHIHQHRFTIC